MSGWLQDLDEADRGFLTWLGAMVRLRIDELVQTIGVVAEGDRIRELDLSPLAPRLAGRPRPLAPPFAGLDGLVRLDCSGLSLPKLDLTHLTTLRHLACASNALRALDLGPVRDLETLDCSGNQLMMLDLRGLASLREVSCEENALAMLALDARSPLVHLDCSHNQLMALNLGEMPGLLELRCTRNALVQLRGDTPVLEVLDAGHNELFRLEVSTGPALRVLRMPHNRLAQLDVPARVEVLDVQHNYLATLDLQRCETLHDLVANHNQLVALAWPTTSQLLRVRLDHNRLSSVAPPAGPTGVLTCDRNYLARLETRELPRLSRLSCAGNLLTTLDLQANPDLVELDVRSNPLSTLDLTPHRSLVRLSADEELALLVPEDALFQVATPPPDVTIDELDTLSLHRLAIAGWRTALPEQLLAMVRHPRCDWGTALLLYWTHRPLQVRRDAAREDLAAFEIPTWELLRAIEIRATTTGFASRRCPFDPRRDRTTASVEGVDWTGGAELTTVPLELRQPSGGPPQRTRPRSTTSDGHQTS